jgi:phosphatidate cytidylyltransferase
MSKVFADDLKEKEEQLKKFKKDLEQKDTNQIDKDKEKDKENSDTAGASGFSEDAEKKFQEKKKGRIEKLHNIIKKGLNPPQEALKENNKSKWADLKVRVRWSLIMVSLFFLILFMGHFYSAVMVLLIVVAIFYELIDIPRFKGRNLEIKNYYPISWYILSLGTYYFYITTVKSRISFLTEYQIFYYLLKDHKFICFMLYCFGFIYFLQSLTKGYYRYQFRQFAYIHIIFMIFGYFSSMIISNIFNGMIWFLLPVSCVVVNDITAYFWGRRFGRKIFGDIPLSPLSPKKSWEGFIGAFFSTIIWCYFFSNFLSNFEWLLCPVEKLTIMPFRFQSLHCDVSELLKINEFSFNLLGKTFKFGLTNLQFHSIFIGLFASSIAPMGGLFASGFKRSIKIKDFADTIPGHGGVTDRMDCEMLNGAFVYIYLSQFVFYDETKIMNGIIGKILKLNHDDQIAIFERLRMILGK